MRKLAGTANALSDKKLPYRARLEKWGKPNKIKFNRDKKARSSTSTQNANRSNVR